MDYSSFTVDDDKKIVIDGMRFQENIIPNNKLIYMQSFGRGSKNGYNITISNVYIEDNVIQFNGENNGLIQVINFKG